MQLGTRALQTGALPSNKGFPSQPWQQMGSLPGKMEGSAPKAGSQEMGAPPLKAGPLVRRGKKSLFTAESWPWPMFTTPFHRPVYTKKPGMNPRSCPPSKRNPGVGLIRNSLISFSPASTSCVPSRNATRTELLGQRSVSRRHMHSGPNASTLDHVSF